MPYALVIDGVVDTISFEDRSDNSGWVQVDTGVFGGFMQQEDGSFLPPAQPTPTPVLADYENAIQDLVDTTARERQFRDGVTLASYTSSTKPKWAAEAQAFVAWRDDVWFYAYGELAKVQAGQRPQPTVDQILGEIVPIDWPS